MTIDQLINVLVTITLIEMMATIGLGVKLVDLVSVARSWRLVGQVALANYLCVPAVTLGLLLLFDAHPMVAAGFLILATASRASAAETAASELVIIREADTVDGTSMRPDRG